MAAAPSTHAPADTTFRSYSSKQAAVYAKSRKGYPPTLIRYIVDHHRATGGKTGVLLDVGCGPGNATRDLSPYFDVVFAADPGQAMLQTATELGGTTATGAALKYRLSGAEEIDGIEELEHGSVDMITAAAAAHWFDMPKFWTAAAKLLKPGGTVAVWTMFPKDREPSTPKEAQLRKIIDRFRAVLAPYAAPGNQLTRAGYVDLVMPWNDAATAALFEQETFVRREFDAKSLISDDFNFFSSGASGPESPLKAVEALIGTLSPVTRWREAHPDLVGTDKDCVKVLIAQISEVLGDITSEKDLSPLLGNEAAAVLSVKRAG